MASTPLPNEEQIPSSAQILQLQAAVRRTPSFSSSSSQPSHSRNSSFRSSSFSFSEESPPFSPTTPLTKFKGIPFSWEKIPGIPKQQESCNKKEYSGEFLPPPPAGKEISPKKHHHNKNQTDDPFVAALMECSKDDDNGHVQRETKFGSSRNIITRSLSDRFGSCKTTCVVSESYVYVPRSRLHYLPDSRPS